MSTGKSRHVFFYSFFFQFLHCQVFPWKGTDCLLSIWRLGRWRKENLCFAEEVGRLNFQDVSCSPSLSEMTGRNVVANLRNMRSSLNPQKKKKDHLFILQNLTGDLFIAKISPEAGKYRWVLSSTVIYCIPVVVGEWAEVISPGPLRKPTLHFRTQTQESRIANKKNRSEKWIALHSFFFYGFVFCFSLETLEFESSVALPSFLWTPRK